jgi:hypothetical protein
MFSTIAGVVFAPTLVQSVFAWKSKWMPRKLSVRLSRFGVASAADATATVTMIARPARRVEFMCRSMRQAAPNGKETKYEGVWIPRQRPAKSSRAVNGAWLTSVGGG